MARPWHGLHRFSKSPAAAICMLERPQAALDFASPTSRRALAWVLVGGLGRGDASLACGLGWGWGFARSNCQGGGLIPIEWRRSAPGSAVMNGRAHIQKDDAGASIPIAHAPSPRSRGSETPRQERPARCRGREVKRSQSPPQHADRSSRRFREAMKAVPRASHSRPLHRAGRGLCRDTKRPRPQRAKIQERADAKRPAAGQKIEAARETASGSPVVNSCRPAAPLPAYSGWRAR